MPICRQRKLAFVHIPKTGGITIESVFGFGRTEADLFGEMDGLELAHLTAQQMMKYVPDFRDYFSFAIVRNPWERLVSEYAWRAGNTSDTRAFDVLGLKKPTFEKFVRCLGDIDFGNYSQPQVNHLYPQSCFTHVGGEQVVTHIGRFEQFEASINEIRQKLGMDLVTIPKLNKSSHRHYSYYYTHKTKEIVESVYRDDIKLYGYTYERDSSPFQQSPPDEPSRPAQRTASRSRVFG
jgi:hypothetical protein